MKKFYKIEDFIDTTSNAFALTGTSPLKANASQVTMASSADVLNEIADSFGERSIYVPETDTPFTSFTAMWARWRSRRGDRLAASWEALHTHYKPLENYDRYEDGKDTRTITPAETTRTTTPAETTNTNTPAETTRTITPAETTNTTSPAEITNTTSPAETTNTNTIVTPAGRVTQTDDSVYAFNSSTAVNAAGRTVTETGSTTDALTVQNTGTDVLTVQTAGSEALTVQTAGSEAVTVQHAGSDALTVQHAGTEVLTVQEAETDEIEYGKHTYGNIGVTSAMDLIRQELEIDTQDFIYKAICEFINLYTVYV